MFVLPVRDDGATFLQRKQLRAVNELRRQTLYCRELWS